MVFLSTSGFVGVGPSVVGSSALVAGVAVDCALVAGVVVDCFSSAAAGSGSFGSSFLSSVSNFSLFVLMFQHHLRHLYLCFHSPSHFQA